MVDQEAKQCELELERPIFFLKTPYDPSQETGYQRETIEIIKNLLLMMIGTLSTSRGVILLFDKNRRKVEALTQRGLTSNSLNRFVQETGSEGFLNFDEITSIPLPPLFSSLNLHVQVPLNVDVTMGGIIDFGEKLSGNPYLPEDRNLLITMARHGAVAIENARLNHARIEALDQSNKELENLNKPKSRTLDHLSYELRTPFSMVQGNIRLTKKKTPSQPPPLMREEIYHSLEKILNRFSEIQQETDQIIRSHKETEKKQRLGNMDLPDFASLETIELYPFIGWILGEIKKQSAHRDLQIDLEGATDLALSMDPKILEDILRGLFKNGIENTPNEGMIKVILERKNRWRQIKLTDLGIGVTKENQRHLWDGLFHTLDTELYTSGKPYDFSAGGKGLDLLRFKTYAQRYGFDISVGSEQCRHLSTDQALCPGRISNCPHCRNPEDCYASGGSTFCISFSVG